MSYEVGRQPSRPAKLRLQTSGARSLPWLVLLATACALAPRLASAAAAGAAVPPQLAAAAVAYANALASGEVTTAYGLLSSQSRAGVTEAQWQQAFSQRRTGVRKPPASAVLRAMATPQAAANIGNVLVRGDEALIEVKGDVQIPQTLVLVRESGNWKVDLRVTDGVNSRSAGVEFLEVLRAEAEASRTRQGQEASYPLLRTLLAPEAKNYKVVDAKVEGDRAEVTVSADVPVSLVLRATRVGAGWTVDYTRPVVPLDISSPDPLKQAAAIADRTDCEEQLQLIARAVQMYASSSADMLPDPDRWVQQIRPFLQTPTKLHCPNDPSPGISFAMNRNLKGKRLHQLANPSLTVMFYESGARGDNPSDLGEGWPSSPRHPEGNLVVYADGSVRPASLRPPFEVKEGAAPAVTAPGGARRPGQPAAPIRVPTPRPRPAG